MAPHDLARERAPLPLPGVRPCVAPRYEPSGRSTRQALACGGALGAGGLGAGGLVVHYLTVARISQALGVSWNTANTAVLAEGVRLLINDPARCEGVRVIGVDEHVWRHTPLRRQIRHRHLGLDSYTRPS